MDYKQEIEKIEKQINSQKMEKVKLEERKRHLEEKETKILEELKKEGIVGDELQEKIFDLEAELEEGIEKCQKILEQK